MCPDFELFGIPFYSYEIFLTIGMLLALVIGDRLGIKRQFSVKLQRFFIVVILCSLMLGLMGAALFQAFYDFLKTGEFKAFGSGMTFYGGFIFGVITFLVLWFGIGKLLKLGKETKEKFKDVADIAGCVVPLGHGFGRLGCLFAGCCHGKITDAWYGITVKFGGETLKVVPLQLFEAIFLFALSAVMFWLFFKKNGEKRVPILPIYAIAYGIWRFCLEFARGDDRGATIVSFLTPSQLVAVLLIAIGGMYLGVYYHQKIKKVRK